jgi:signal transduction histidine kinase
VDGSSERFHPGDDDQPPRGVLLSALMSSDPAPAPSLAALERARARQEASRRLLRPLGLGVVVLVELTGSGSGPHPGLSGRSLGVLLALAGFAGGVLGGMFLRRVSYAGLVGLFVLLVLSSSALAWLQPDGPGFLGCFVAVSAGAMRLPERSGAALAGLAVLSLGVAMALTPHQTVAAVLLSDFGVIAFYVVARLAHRLREGQDQAVRMLAELERSHRAQAEAAALAERQRLAREMHDVLAHSLSGLVLQLEGAHLLADRGGADLELAAALERALHLGKAGLAEARRAIGMLRDEELPGPERLPALLRDFERDAGVPCRIEVSGGERPLGSEARLTLYRVAQEALTNVRRHARAARAVELRLAYEVAGTRLVVEDFTEAGTGALSSAAPGGPDGNGSLGAGYGITGMRERAELLGGRLLAGPTEAGFRVELWVPA